MCKWSIFISAKWSQQIMLRFLFMRKLEFVFIFPCLPIVQIVLYLWIQKDSSVQPSTVKRYLNLQANKNVLMRFTDRGHLSTFLNTLPLWGFQQILKREKEWCSTFMTFLVLSKSQTSIPIVMENIKEGKKHSVFQINYN